MKQFGIYKWTNLVTGRVLVGQTGSTVGFKKRKNNYMSELRRGIYNNSYFQRSWNKHKEENFAFEILETHLDNLSLTAREQFWLDYYRALSAGVYNNVG